ESQVQAPLAVDDERESTVDPHTLVGWVIAEAHRSAQGETPNAVFLDLRPSSTDVFPGAVAIDTETQSPKETIESIKTQLPETFSGNQPLVLIDHHDTNTAQLAQGLRLVGINAMTVDGGFEAWQALVLAEGATWALPVLRSATAAVGDITEPENTEPEDMEPEVSATAELRRQLRQWLTGAAELPPRFVFPGSIPPPSKAATVKAVGGAGGGCG
ncbi:MAG: rhodanese-like domain-containing protein, partial [Proteobacteria bacterium]|nr:rhodanese-like domain-containing protein [Pseudomonadota bacterium]